ncbi:predicted protein [Plenodomus lingam JN3]|uniref:Predicted protein n=1 Tax=Leptosphaeria maculans (strain JN3 / isolate v23.1.3 / race Av1-4-5-6-7-8) TaxID=985895 RepID=E5A2B7_LEPMJ|nr:predicted protein [Plenodomus lingam JN3]CBX97552.1 predicted protein [Plenodomus lingam JN3]
MGKHGQDAKSFYEVHVTEPGLLHLSQSLGQRVFEVLLPRYQYNATVYNIKLADWKTGKLDNSRLFCRRSQSSHGCTGSDDPATE